MRTSLLATLLASVLLVACGGDKTAGGKTASGEDALPKPVAVSGSVTGMPNPGESTPNPGQPVDVPPVDELDVPADIVPVDGEAATDIDGMPQTATPEPPEPETMPMPPTESAVPANGGDTGNPGADPQ